MVVSQLGTNAPNGSVGVNNWLRNAEMDMYTAGVLNGFTPSFDGMNILPAGGSTNNACIALNPNGDREVFASNAKGTSSLALAAPTTSGQSLCYAIVVSRDTSVTTTANNGLGSVQMNAIPGTAATTGSETIPTESQIRANITNGSTAFICVVMTITVPQGVTALTSAMVNKTSLSGVTINGQTAINGDPYHANPVFEPYMPTITTLTTDTIRYTAQMLGIGTGSPLLALQIKWVNKGAFTSTQWGNVNLLRVNGWKVAGDEVWGWCMDNNKDVATQYTSRFYAVENFISWRDSGSHQIGANVWHNGGLLLPVVPM